MLFLQLASLLPAIAGRLTAWARARNAQHRHTPLQGLLVKRDD